MLDTALFKGGNHPRILKLNIIWKSRVSFGFLSRRPHLTEKEIEGQLTDSEHTEDCVYLFPERCSNSQYHVIGFFKFGARNVP
jgi:hypothetical protein